MNKEKIKVEIYTNADRAFEDEAEEILKDNDKKAIINILKQNFDLEDSLLDLESQLKLYKDNKKYLNKEIERLNNIINELEKYINEEYIYDELGMKIFDASKLQDKLQELKGSDKE